MRPKYNLLNAETYSWLSYRIIYQLKHDILLIGNQNDDYFPILSIIQTNPIILKITQWFPCFCWLISADYERKKQEREKEEMLSGSVPPVLWLTVVVIWILEEMRVITNSDLNISPLHEQLVYQSFSYFFNIIQTERYFPSGVRTVLTVEICIATCVLQWSQESDNTGPTPV